MLVIPFAGTALIGAILVLIWARVTRTPLREIGFAGPRNWARAVAVGCLFGVAFKVVMKALVMPLFGADPVNRAYHYLAGNAPAAAFMAVFVIVSGGFAEETDVWQRVICAANRLGIRCNRRPWCMKDSFGSSEIRPIVRTGRSSTAWRRILCVKS
jgi:hypothetical protein